MRQSKIAVAALAMLGAVLLAVPVATAHAAPAVTAGPSATAKIAPGGQSVIVELSNGTAAVDPAGGRLTILGTDGRRAGSVPLAGAIDGFAVPLQASVGADGRTVTLTPSVPGALRAVLDGAETKAAKRLTKQQRYDIMWAELNKGWRGNTPLYTLIGGLIGFIVFALPGAAVGAAIGAYVGYQETNPKAWPSVVAWWNTP